MGISVFPSGGGEFITNDFVVDMNDTENNVIDLGRSYAAGAYDISIASGDTSFDIYAVDQDGNPVGYTNNATLVASGGFTQLAILGVANDEKITFAFSGASNNATSEGDAIAAGAYLESINPSDLPDVDDTANVIGGNFATDVEFFFESGTVSLPAKNIVRSDSTALVVTRPDAFDPALDPWDVRVVNPGIPEPTGTNANILAGTVDAGATPIWVTTSPLPTAFLGQAYAATVVATDADGDVTYSVTAGSLPSGLSLNGATGVISGTATESSTFTIQALDAGANANTREFELPFAKATGGTIYSDSGYVVHQFDSSDDFVALETLTIEYQVIAGGGGSGASYPGDEGGGGGAGGFRSSIASDPASGGGASLESTIALTAGTHPVTVGAGGIAGTKNGNTAERDGGSGSSSSISTISTVGGGYGDGPGSPNNGGDGGSGGAGCSGSGFTLGGNGTANQGFDGGDGVNNTPGGGGGAGSAGGTGNAGAGITSTVTGSSTEIAKGGAPRTNAAPTGAGTGGNSVLNGEGKAGNDGRVIVRYLA